MSQTAVTLEFGLLLYSFRCPREILPSPITPMPMTSLAPRILEYEAAVAAMAARLAKPRRDIGAIEGILAPLGVFSRRRRQNLDALKWHRSDMRESRLEASGSVHIADRLLPCGGSAIRRSQAARAGFHRRARRRRAVCPSGRDAPRAAQTAPARCDDRGLAGFSRTHRTAGLRRDQPRARVRTERAEALVGTFQGYRLQLAVNPRRLPRIPPPFREPRGHRVPAARNRRALLELSLRNRL